ncbi:MAG: hypothetical protein ACM3KM_01990 [Acidobacteriaceae bacterium]
MAKKIKVIIAFLALLSALSLGFLIWMVAKSDPNENPWLNLSIFYAAVLCLSIGLLTIAGFFVRQKLGVREFAAVHLKTAARQSALAGILIVCSLILQSFRLFSWLNSLILLLALISLEFYFLFNERKHLSN